MIIIKSLILILIFVFCLLLGIVVSKKYTQRVKELKDIKNALNMFETKIKFTYESVPEIFEDISNQVEGNVGNIFRYAYSNMKELSAGEAWKNAIDNTNLNLNVEDKEILKTLGKLLGKTDIEGQISEIELVSQFLDTQIDLAEKEKNKNEKMYKTLGGIIGLVLVIIFI